MIEKTNISARVECTLKQIVNESEYTHKDAYELGAKLIAMGNVEETIIIVNKDPNLERRMKKTECRILTERKNKLERELRDM